MTDRYVGTTIFAFFLICMTTSWAATQPSETQAIQVSSDATWWAASVQYGNPITYDWTDGAQVGDGVVNVPVSEEHWTGVFFYEPDANAYTYGLYMLGESWLSASPTPEPTSTPDPAATATPTPTPLGEFLTLNLPGDVSLEMVRVPAGSLEMGSADAGYGGDTEPVHTVTMAYDYYVAKHELTQAQWKAVMGTSPWEGRANALHVDDAPAVYVSWEDAQSFVGALNTHLAGSGQAGVTVRLPSESEWERACRAGTSTDFYWGSDDDALYMWSGGSISSADIGEGYARQVGRKQANAFGLYDMSGNVLEWVQDCYHRSYTGAPTGGNAWEHPADEHRVLRGGHWDCPGAGDSLKTSSAYRWHTPPSIHDAYIGFRIVAIPNSGD